MRRALARLLLASASAAVLGACGGAQPGAPDFRQAFGVIDAPCAAGLAPSTAVQHCVAHVVLQDAGGEGIGHATLQVPLKAARTGSPLAPAVCGMAIPDTPAGGYSDLVCNFDVPPGDTIAGFPVIGSIDYATGSTRTSAGFDFGGAGSLILAAATLLLALALLLAAPWRRGTPAVLLAPAASADELGPDRSPESRPAPRVMERRRDVDAEYDLPSIPR